MTMVSAAKGKAPDLAGANALRVVQALFFNLQKNPFVIAIV